MFLNTTVLVMEIAHEEIRVLRYSRNLVKNDLRTSDTEDLPSIELPCTFAPDPEKKEILVRLLTDFRLKNLGTRKVKVYLLIPFQNGLIRILRIPWIAGKHRNKAIKYSIEHEISFTRGELIYHYLIAEEKKAEYLSVMLIGIRKETLSLYTDCFNQAGYKVQGAEYTVAAIGKELIRFEGQSILCLQSMSTHRVQAVLYINCLPVAVKTLPTGKKVVLNYLIYLLLKKSQVPLDRIITDGCSQTELIAGELLTAGFAKTMETQHYHRDRMALGHGMQRIQDKENINFLLPLFRAAKIRVAVLVSSMLLILFILLGYSVYSHSVDQIKNNKEITALQETITSQRQETYQTELFWKEWIGARKEVLSDYQWMYASLAIIDRDIFLTRVSYRQGSLFIWAHCSDNAAIIRAMNKLTINGWGKPQLLEYYSKEGQVDFCLSVQREKDDRIDAASN